MVYSISHIDLDGYGSQYVLSKIFKEIEYHNVNYGDVKDKIIEITSKMNSSDKLFITDLNLSIEDASITNDIILSKNLNVRLIDHHDNGGIGSTNSALYEWYILDNFVCGTYGVFNYFNDKLKSFVSYNDIKEMVEYINVSDMWIQKDKRFNKANFISDCVFNFPEIINEQKAVKARILLLNVISENLSKSISELEEELFSYYRLITEELFEISEGDYSILTKIKIVQYKDLMNEIVFEKNVGDYNIAVFRNIDSGIFQYSSSEILNIEYGNYVLINLSKSGGISIRSKNGKAINVAKYLGGGGHDNASGAFTKNQLETIGKLTLFKDNL